MRTSSFDPSTGRLAEVAEVETALDVAVNEGRLGDFGLVLSMGTANV